MQRWIVGWTALLVVVLAVVAAGGIPRTGAAGDTDPAGLPVAEADALALRLEAMEARLGALDERVTGLIRGAGASRAALADLIRPNDPWTVRVEGTDHRSEIGGGRTPAMAQGEYVVVVLNLTNGSGAPLAFPYEQLALTDDSGRILLCDTGATRLLLLWERHQGYLDEVAPGGQYATVAVFDVPPDATGLTLVDAPGLGRVVDIALDA